jgi:predicted phage tail protein
MTEPSEFETPDYSERDAASLKILGFFFSVLGALVLVATYWTLGNKPAVIVNVASGTTLVVIGLGMMVFVRRKSKKDQ